MNLRSESSRGVESFLPHNQLHRQNNTLYMGILCKYTQSHILSTVLKADYKTLKSRTLNPKPSPEAKGLDPKPAASTLTLHERNSVRVQVPNKHILTQNLYYNYYYPKSKCLIIGYMDPLELASRVTSFD